MAQKDSGMMSVSDMMGLVDKGPFKNVYLFYGEEDYLKDYFVSKLCKKFTDGDTSGVIRFDGKINASELRDACDTMPMFGTGTVAVVSNSGIFKSAGKGTESDFSFLSEIPEDSFVLFKETEADVKNKNFKIVADCGTTFECKHQSEGMVVKILARQAGTFGAGITPAAVSLMMTGISPDLTRLMNETAKLALYVGEGGLIDTKQVRECCELSLAAKIFDLTDGIAENNREKSLTMLQSLLSDRMPPQKILDAIGRQYMQLYDVKCLVESGLQKNEISSKLGIHDFVAGKLIKQARNYTTSLISDRIGIVADMDMAVKTGAIDPVRALEIIIGS